ncbi:MAG: c-type cytochrome, partial [Planctomycetota bacterium]
PLIDLFQESDELSAHAWAEIKDVKEAKKIGSDLVGSNGLNCVACHTFQQKPAQTMQAVDLTEMAERLQRDWFEIYMRNPQTLSPGTVMPSFWPGGKAIRSEILDGDTDQQIATLWTYLQDGRQARQPRGVVIEPMELLAGKEAVMLRRNYQGIGRRGIGVGYSSKVNLTFDAEQLRLASLWRGEFVDPGAAWRGQGSGSVRPLSRDVTRFPSGPDLDSVANPWIVDEGRPPRHQFKGYRLDSQRRPAFRYRFDEVDVEDYLVDRGEIPSSTVSLRRSIRLTTAEPRDGLRFRIAASDKAIEQVDDSTFRLSNGLRVQVLSQTPAEMTEADGRSQLVIPLNLPAGDTVLEVSYQW